MKAAGEIEKHGHFSAEIQAAVKAELDTMLVAPVFAQSSRCKRFLSHVVLETLSGNAHQLKERTIGVTVFSRANDYDTGDDSIVRVTANEVRKRIGQYYAESHLPHAIQIELPRGSYVPEFTFHPTTLAARHDRSHTHTHAHGEGRSSPAEEHLVPATHAADDAPEHVAHAHNAHADATHAPVAHEATAHTAPFEAASHEAPRHDVDVTGSIPQHAHAGSTHRRFMSLLIVVVLLGGAVAVWGWNIRGRRPAPDVWDAFVHANGPVLVCLGAHDPLDGVNPSPFDKEKFSTNVLGRQIIPLDDAAVISSIASLMGKKGIPFRVLGADQASLTDLRRQPVVLIGALDNKWTLRLLQGLPYRIEEKYPGGPDTDPIASIVDAQQPAGASWTVDFRVPMNTWKNDYAVVSRIDDSETGLTAFIEAGLGNNGSLAAAEFITSGAFAARVAGDPACAQKPNSEAVIETEMIDDKAGPPRTVRFVCW